MRLKIKQYFAGFVLLGSIGFMACTQETEYHMNNLDHGIRLNVNVATPLVKGEISVEELMHSYNIDLGNIKVDPNGLLFYYRKDSVIYNNLIDLLVPNSSINFVSPLSGSFNSIPGRLDSSSVISYGLVFDTPYSSYDFITFKSGTFNFVPTFTGGTTAVDFYFNVTIPSLYSKSTGKPFSVNVHRNSGVVAVPMVDYYYKTGVKDKKGVMTINTTVFKNTGTYSGLASYPSMRFLLQTSNVLINYAEGLGPASKFLASDGRVISFPIDQKQYTRTDTSIRFSDPHIIVSGANNLGIDIEVGVNNSVAYSSDGAKSEDFVYTGSRLIAKGAKSMVTGNVAAITPASFSFDFNASNSNIASLASALYDKYRMLFDVMANPDGEKPNFISNDYNNMTVFIETKIPLKGKFYRLGYSDYLDFDFYKEVVAPLHKDSDYINDIRKFTFTATLDNELPIGINCQFYLLDENNVPMDSLFRNGRAAVLAFGEQNSAGLTTQSNKVQTTLEFDKSRIDILKKIKRIVMDVEGSTNQKQNVQFFDYQKLKFSIGVKVDETTNSNF